MAQQRQRAVAGPIPASAAALVVLLACAAVGSWTLVGQWVGRFAAMLIPEALGVPSGLPPLRLTPLGATTRDQWLVDAAAALLLAAVVWWRCRWTRRPLLGGWFAAVAGLVVATTVRVLHGTIVAGHDPVSYAATLFLALLLAVVVGALLGIPVGIVHLVVFRRRAHRSVTAAEPTLVA